MFARARLCFSNHAPPSARCTADTMPPPSPSLRPRLSCPRRVPSLLTRYEAYNVRDAYYSSSSGMPVYSITPASAEWDYTAVAAQDKLLALKAEVDANQWIVDGSTEDWCAPARPSATTRTRTPHRHT